jgi:hypothetical protein
MKKILPILILLISFNSNAQRTLFGRNNNYVGPLVAPTLSSTTTSTITSYTAILGGVLSSTGGATTTIGINYTSNVDFNGAYSTTTINSNATAGTYSTSISGLSAVTNYIVRSFATNAAGTTYGPTISFITLEGPKTLGQVYGGGIVFYILLPGDTGYDANVQHGLIASFADQSSGISWSNGNNITTGATGRSIGTGRANTDAIIASQGANSTSYAAGLARAYNGGGYTDWYLGSEREMLKYSGSVDGQVHGSGICFTCWYSPVTPFTTGVNEYWTSSEVDSTQAFRQNVGSPSQYLENKSNTKGVRAIRSF